MKKTKKNRKRWSRKHYQAKFGFWNPLSYSNERHIYCRAQQYDVLGLGELHNVQVKKQFQDRRWICSAAAEKNKSGKCSDPAAGVAILLSNRMADKVIDSGHVGTRIAWVRLAGPVCNIFFIVAYVPHKGRVVAPFAQDTIKQLRQLLRTVHKSECIIMCGDLNCQLQRNVPGCTGKWSMTQKPNKKGHGHLILELMREHDLFAVGTLFKPKKKTWNGKRRLCNATYISKIEGKRPKKLDSHSISPRYISIYPQCKRIFPTVYPHGI